MMNIENVVAVESFLLPGAARDTACQPNTTQLTTELKLSGPGGAASVKFVTICSIQNLDFVTFYPVFSVKSVFIALCYK